MAKYLISFPSAAMVVPEGEWEAVGRDAHAVINEAKAAGVYVFGGGIDEDVPPALVSTVQSSRAATLGRPRSTAASPCSNCLRARRRSRGPRVSRRPAAVPKSCASLGLTRSLEGGRLSMRPCLTTFGRSPLRPNKSLQRTR